MGLEAPNFLFVPLVFFRGEIIMDDIIDQFVTALNFDVVMTWANILEVEINPPPLGDMWPDWEVELRTEVADAMKKVGEK